MSSAIRIGVIGCGRIAEIAHLPAYRLIRKGRVVAVADVDASRVEMIAKKFGVEVWHNDPAVVIEDPNIDAVNICLPVYLHSEFVLKALDHGKHVFCEKPMALNVAEADRIIKKVGGTDLKLMVGYNQRFEAPFKKMRELVRSKLLGNLITIEGKYSKCGSPERYLPPNWRSDPRKGGGALLDHACHKLDMIQWLAGRVVEVTALTAYNLKTDAEDTAGFLARHTTGAISIFTFGLVCAAPVSELDTITLCGEKGTVSFTSMEKKELKLYLQGKLLGRTASFTRIGLSQRESSYALELESFVDSIMNRRHPPITAEDARSVLLVSEMARRSAESGRTVKISS